MDAMRWSIVTGQQSDVRLAEDYGQVPPARVFPIPGHVQVGIHPGFETRDAAQLAALGRVGLVTTGAADQYIKAGVSPAAQKETGINADAGL